jgi:hypothetical protein
MKTMQATIGPPSAVAGAHGGECGGEPSPSEGPNLGGHLHCGDTAKGSRLIARMTRSSSLREVTVVCSAAPCSASGAQSAFCLETAAEHAGEDPVDYPVARSSGLAR